MSAQSTSSELSLLIARLITGVRARSPRRVLEMLLLLLAGVAMAGAGAIFRVIRLTVGAVLMLILDNLGVRAVGRLLRSAPFIRH